MIETNETRVMTAYADCWMSDERDGMKLRNLSYVSSDFISLYEWESLMNAACPDGYNDFSATKVADAIREIAGNAVDSLKFRAAREGSVACYVSGDLSLLDKLCKLSRALYADEAHIDSSSEELRLWWD